MNIELGKQVQQRDGFSAFIPLPFPPKKLLKGIPHELLYKTDSARGLVGDLNGITHVLPAVDFFLAMFVFKDATPSAQIEGTQATFIDAIEMKAGVAAKDTDADDIVRYVAALYHGLELMKTLPLSLRFIKGIHRALMKDARSSHYSAPGEFRAGQNWIGGTSPGNARFVPPPATEMQRAMSDLETFLHQDSILPLLQIGLAHAQFETIHPFLDGNGRVGRLLIALMLHQKKLLEKPTLFLSSYFKKHQQTYYDNLDAYRKGGIEEWLHFFLDGVIETAREAIEISKAIRVVYDEDMKKMQALAKKPAESGTKVLTRLFAQPLVTSAQVMQWTGFTRAGANGVIDNFVNLGILEPAESKSRRGKAYIYRKYLACFDPE